MDKLFPDPPPVGDHTQTHWFEKETRLKTLAQSCLVLSHVQKEFTSVVTIMPQICHGNQPPSCHFVMLTGSALFDECLKMACFLCYRVLNNVCKTGLRFK